MVGERSDIAENDVVRVERIVPTSLRPGQETPVRLEVIAKEPLRELRVEDDVSEELAVVGGTPKLSAADVAPGTALTVEYAVRADAAGTFALQGRVTAETAAGQQSMLEVPYVLSSGAIFVRAQTDLFVLERWITPASVEPHGTAVVTTRVTPSAALRSLAVREMLPPEFRQLDDGSVPAPLEAGRAVTRSFRVRAGTETGLRELAAEVDAEDEAGHATTTELKASLAVYPRLVIGSLDDPAWVDEVRPRLLAVVNPDRVNQHLFLGNAVRLMGERANIAVTSDIRDQVSLAFQMREASGGEPEPGGVVSADDYDRIQQGEATIYPIEDFLLLGEEECELDDVFDYSALREVPSVEPGPDPGLGANFDSVLQLKRDVFSLVFRFFIADLRAQGHDRITLSLPFGLGSITGIIDAIEVTALRPSVPPGQVEADLQGTFTVTAAGLFRLVTNGGTVSISFQNVGLALTQTPAGLPTGLQVVVAAAQLGTVNVRLGGILGWLLRLFVVPVLRFGVWMAFRLIRRVEIPVWELVDAFSQIGLNFGQGSPFLTALADSALVAADFKPHDGSGQPGQLQNLLPPAANIGVAVNQRLVNQLVGIMFAKGYLPQTARSGRVRITLNSVVVSLRPGLLIADVSFTARYRQCLCNLKGKGTAHAEVAARVELNPAAVPNPPALAFRFNVDIRAKVQVGGFLGVTLWLLVGIELVTLWALLNHLVNNNLNQLASGLGTQIINRSLPAPLTAVQFTLAGLAPSGLLSVSLEFTLAGTGSISLQPFTTIPLLGQQAQLTFDPQSLVLDDEEVRLAAALS